MIEEGKFLLNKDTGEEVTLTNEDFVFVQKDKKIHDVKFSKKATTFFKDAMKRFAKSKSAVVGGSIVGILAIMAIIVPSVMPSNGAFDVRKESAGGNVAERLIQPKLFPTGTGFWDGTIKKTKILYNEKTQTPNGYREGVFFNLKTYDEFSNNANELGKGGYVNLASTGSSLGTSLSSPVFTVNLNNEYTFTTKTFSEEVPGYKNGAFDLYFKTTFNEKEQLIPLTNSSVNTGEEFSVKLVDEIKKAGITADTIEGSIEYKVKEEQGVQRNILIESAVISSNITDAEQLNKLKLISFTDANEMLIRDSSSEYNWENHGGVKGAYKVKFTYCDFTYDQYEDIYGDKEHSYSPNDVLKLEVDGILQINLKGEVAKATKDPKVLQQRFNVFDNNVIVEIIEQVGDATYNRKTRQYEGYTLKCKIHGYSLYGYDKMPLFVFGTNSNRKDYFKLIFTGLRFSFILAILVSAVNIVIGLIWGSISGYFGGWTDILMERFCEILSGVPSTVVITLCILYGAESGLQSSFTDVIALMIALFLTGWMGVAGRTRTQFYRFKGREYVLASRTLGAKDARLIFRHILPNSMGTIITSSILMIPSVIYTEASIAYLGLGLSGQVMFGVILSEANVYYTGESTYMLIIPTIIMAFLLVSFNMFGNGLRDAFNPQLKGSE